MGKKYLKAFKNKGRSYWWLVEAHRENGKVVHKKLKYWGINKPGEDYREILMPLDDRRPLNDLWVIWQGENNRWHGQKRGDMMFWYKHNREDAFWKYFKKEVSLVHNKNNSEIWLTRAPDKSQAITNVKGNLAKGLVGWLALSRMTD